MRAMRIMLLFAVLVLLSGTAASADWPMFGHDPQHTGVAGESVEPPLELLWEFNINSSTASSPVVSGGTAYIVAFRLNNSYLYALDAVTGAEKWKWKCEPSGFLFGVPSPAVHNETVYLYSGDGTDWRDGYVGYMYALDATTGAEKWKYRVVIDVLDAVSSPVVHRGTIYLCADDCVYALDATDGTEKWKTKTDGWHIGSSPAVYGSTVYVGIRGKNSYVCALDAATGAEKWRYVAGMVYWYWSSPVVYESTIYICADDCVYALDAITGESEWKYRTGDNISSSPAVCSGTVYVGSQDRYVYALDATTGRVEWKYKTGSPIYSTPVISGETVYIRPTDRNLYALDRTTGKKKGAYRIDRHVYGFAKYSSPAVSENAIYINTDLGYVYALAPYDTSTLATALVAAISQNTTLFVISVMLFGIIFIFSITYFIRRNYNSKIKDDTRFFIGLIATMILLWSSGFDPASGAIRTGAIVIVWMWAFIGLKSKYWRAFVGYYVFTSSVFWLYAIAMEISSDLWVRSEVMIACLPFLFYASFGTIPVFLLLMGVYIADKAGFIKKLRKYLNYLYKEKIIWGTNTKKHKEKRRKSTNSDKRKHETHKKSAGSTKDDTRPYYYKVLDVSTDASRDEIKKAYRRLSMLYHPDASTDPDAEQKMKEINKAHDVLSDPDKRARYDNFENAFKG